MRSILIVDDDTEYRQGLKVLLDSKNYAVLEAVNGREAMTLLDQKTIDLVITDIFMPEQEGIETIQAIKRRHPNVKVIAISASDPAALRVAGRLGADATFSKSVRFDRLVEMVERLHDDAITG